MKKIALFLILISFLSLNAQDNEIKWISFEEALEAQKINPKKIMMDVFANWCGPCKLMDKKTFHNTDLVNFVNEHFYAVKFNGEGHKVITYKGEKYGNPNYDKTKEFTRNSSHQLTDYFQVNGFPSILFFDEIGNLLAPLPGYRTPKQLEVFLKLFKNGDYKNIDTEEKFKKYMDDFKYEFKV
jgi:thioredoxin-related protein